MITFRLNYQVFTTFCLEYEVRIMVYKTIYAISRVLWISVPEKYVVKINQRRYHLILPTINIFFLSV